MPPLHATTNSESQSVVAGRGGGDTELPYFVAHLGPLASRVVNLVESTRDEDKVRAVGHQVEEARRSTGESGPLVGKQDENSSRGLQRGRMEQD